MIVRLLHSSVVTRPSRSVLISSLDDGLDPFCKLAAWHKDLAATVETAYTDVCPQPDDAPLEASTRVRLSHSYHVIQVDISRVNHCSCCSRGP